MKPNTVSAAENYTGHLVNLVINDDIVPINPVNERNRLEWRDVIIGKVFGVPIVKRYFLHDSCFLPSRCEGTFYIVSSAVAKLYAEQRPDLIYPATYRENRDDKPVFDDEGKLLAVRRFRSPDMLVSNAEMKQLEKVYG
jgi:hypothetical protein